MTFGVVELIALGAEKSNLNAHYLTNCQKATQLALLLCLFF